MQKFELANPTTTAQAVSLLGQKWGDAEVLAGGTDLLSLMKDFIVTPKRLVNLKGIKALSGINSSEAGLRIGALATFEEVLDSVAVRRGYPALLEAVAGVTSPQIRAMGTVGGDLCQRPRCWYFRGGYGLLGLDRAVNHWSRTATTGITRSLAMKARRISSTRQVSPPLW
jgi:xanthine dehydrogenase YagS FAD-binding subunit